MNINISNEQSTEEYFLKIETLDLSVESLSKEDFSNQLVMAALIKMINDINTEEEFLIKDIGEIDIDDSTIHFKLKLEEYYPKTVEFLEVLLFLDLIKMKLEDNLSEEYRVTFLNVNMKKFEEDFKNLTKSVKSYFKFEI